MTNAIALEVAAALDEATSEVGNGTPLQGTLTRTTGADETTYPPTPGQTLAYIGTVMLSQFSTRDRDGTNIKASDLKALITPLGFTRTDAPAGSIDPENGDKLQIDGATYSLVQVWPYKPGGDVLYFIGQARAGG